MTTIKIAVDLRDRLAEVANSDYGGATLAETLRRLVDEHENQTVLAAYERLRNDPEEWADYQAEVAEWDVVTADALRNDS